MYVVKNYLTDETVAITTRKADAVAMMRGSSRPEDPKLIVEKYQKEVDKPGQTHYMYSIGQTNTEGYR